MTQQAINHANMFEPLLEADPSFQPHWEAFLADYGEDAELPLYIALWSLADHIQAHLEAGRSQVLDSIFSVVERWHLEGDHYVSEAATIGLLESLQGIGGDYGQWMRPETARWWNKLNRFWDQGDDSALRFDT
jgi:hypothetical protein